MARQVFFWAFVGHTGTGKTQTALQVAKMWKKANPKGKVIGFDPHDVLSNAGLLDYYISPKDENWATWLMQRDKNGKYKFADSLLILDDYRSLLTGNDCPTDVLELLALRRRLGLDWIYITHNPKLILNRFTYYTNYLSIFYVEAHASDWSDKIPKYAACQKASNLINKYIINQIDEGRTRNPNYTKDDLMKECYPDFPHVIVRMESDQLEAMNVKQDVINRLQLA